MDGQGGGGPGGVTRLHRMGFGIMRSGRRQARILVVQPRAVNVAGPDRLDARPSGLGIGRGASTALKVVRCIIPARCLDLEQTRRLLPRYHVRHASYLNPNVPMIINHLIGLLAHPLAARRRVPLPIRSSITWWDSSPARLGAHRIPVRHGRRPALGWGRPGQRLSDPGPDGRHGR